MMSIALLRTRKEIYGSVRTAAVLSILIAINNKFTQYVNNPGNENSLSNDVIVSLCLAGDNKLWIGTYFGGLNCFDGKKFIRYKHDSFQPEKHFRR